MAFTLHFKKIIDNQLIMKKTALIIALFLATGNLLFAQKQTKTESSSTSMPVEHEGYKLGWINSGDLLNAMPEKTKADSDIAKYTRAFQEQIETMMKEYQTKGQEFQAKEKTMNEAVKEVKMKEIQDLQNRIEGIQQSAQEKVQTRKQELYTPILDKATNAIKAVAKEKGYDYIFDTSNGFVLFARDGDNILPLVKAKMGIK